MSRESDIAEYWRLFTELSSQLAQLTSAEDPIYDRLLEKLHRIDPGLFIELSAESDHHRELVITADGNSELFALADQVVDAAPRLDGWTILALKPRLGF